MNRAPFGKLGFDISRLGMGCMRLPTAGREGKTVIDRPRAIELIRAAAAGGVDYFDTAYVYHHQESEEVLGEALAGGLRERVKIATKLPVWMVNERADMDRLLSEELRRLQTDHIDFYLLHALDRKRYEKMRALGALEFLRKAKADGRIGYAAFSFHDDAETFRWILDDNDWDMAQIQFNYLDEDNQATLGGLRYAGQKGVPVVVMEPLRGGALADPPPGVRAVMDGYAQKRTPADWAFRFAADHQEVATILSGMGTMAQLQENLAIFDTARAGCLSAGDRAMLARVKEEYKRRAQINCTGCGYCQPCPQGVAIPELFAAYDNARMLDRPAMFRSRYESALRDGQDAARCVGCGLCEGQCPQHLPIIRHLKTLHEQFEKGAC